MPRTAKKETATSKVATAKPAQPAAKKRAPARKPLPPLNKRMMNFVYSSLEPSDVVCLLIDATEKFGHGDEYVLEILHRVKTPVFLLINKVDVVRKDKGRPIIDHYKDLFPFREIAPIS